ncbi:MAG: ABC transporter permease [Pirellulales bacterium]|nr:ABC transporter permease [Pirellulales bacterium]
MNPLAMLLAEIRYRKLNFLLSLVAVAVAAMLFVTGPILVDGYGRQTDAELAALEARVRESARRVDESEAAAAAELAELEDKTRIIMRDMGFNLSIIHRDNDMVDYWAQGMPQVDMPREYVDRLAGDRGLTLITHLVATLRGTVEWKDRAVRLVGYLPETTASHQRRKPPMGYRVEPGTVLVGHQLQPLAGSDPTIEIQGRTLRVAGALPEQGAADDSSLVVHLSDAQAILGKPDAINQILALECNCAEADLPRVRRQLADILPDTYIIRDVPRAAARASQRDMVAQHHRETVARHREELHHRQEVLAETAAQRGDIQRMLESLATALTLLVVGFAAVWVGLLALGNVRERRTEIGLLRAVGKGAGVIAALFLGRAVLVGLLGAVVGLGLGIILARGLGAGVLGVPATCFHVPAALVAGALAGAPLLAAVACYLPTVWALRQDPAVVLREN